MPYTFNPFTGNFDSAPSVPAVEGVYLPLSGGTVTGNLSVEGNFEIGSSLPTATMFLSGNRVGINTETPNKELTVIGNISATNVVYADGGNSDIWNESYSLIQSNSASWVSDSTVDTGVRALTSNWESTYTTFRDASSTFLTSETDSQTLSFDEVTKDLSISNGNIVSLSALVDGTAIDTGVRALTSNWESTYTTVLGNSASWVNTLSAQTAEVLIAKVYNADTATMVKGNVVYAFGATGDVMSVKLASNVSDTTSSKTLGFVNETIAPGAIGYVIIAGQIEKMSLSHQTFTEGDALWLGSTSGTFTNVKPTAPNHGVYLGVVERANNGDGLAYVKVQNGYELDEIHDVLITSVSAGQILRRNNINNLWINTDDGVKWDATYTTVNSNSAIWDETYTTFRDTSGNYLPLTGGTITGNLSVEGNTSFGTNPSVVLYANQTSVGINTESPNEELTVVGNVSATGSYYGDGSNLTGIVAGDTVATTLVRSNSANWNSTYTTVQGNSSTNWNYQGTDIKTLSGKWENTYTTVQNNSANWDNANVKVYVDSNFVPLTGGTITGSLSVLGNITYIDTAVAVTSAMYIDTASSETALRITQRGLGDVIRVEDSANPDSTPFIINSDGLVGVGTSSPNEELTVVGSISSTEIVYASGGNSNNWNSVYNNVQATSGTNVKTVANNTPGLSAVTTIVTVSAIPVVQVPGTLYILM